VKYKPDWPEARRRLTALWRHERLDRPCIAVTAPLPGDPPPPLPAPADEEARWLDPSYRVEAAVRGVRSSWWGGEALPSFLLMANWVICLGGTPRFDPATIWFQTGPVDFHRPSPFRHDPASPWVGKYTALFRALNEAAGRDEFFVGKPGGLPANDLLSMFMGTEDFLYALVDHPEWMAEAILNGARDQLRAKREILALVPDRGEYWCNPAGWMPFWAPEPHIVTQSDVSCMLSPEMYDRFVVPELDVYGAEHGALWYHLDGGDARQHLPRLLSLPYVKVVQYTPAPIEPPNGPAHLPMYRKIQAAGRIVHIELPVQNVEPFVRELDPALLLLHIRCSSRDGGERLLADAVCWARSAHSARRNA
jgi:hypothetical protein